MTETEKKKIKKRKEKKNKVKPSATQIFPSASPPTSFFLLGSCLFIGFLCWALIPMHSFVDFQVDWPMLLFRSRPQIPCRDITLCLCRFQLFVSDVATSIPCRDISSCLCSFQLVSSYVETSISCRDISSCLLQLSTGVFLCRDINLLSRHQLMSFAALNWCLLMSRHQSFVATSLYASAGFNCSFLMSRHQSLVATSAHVFAAFNWCLLMSRHQSLVATST